MTELSFDVLRALEHCIVSYKFAIVPYGAAAAGGAGYVVVVGWLRRGRGGGGTGSGSARARCCRAWG